LVSDATPPFHGVYGAAFPRPLNARADGTVTIKPPDLALTIDRMPGMQGAMC
jgi:hypothetical protein